MYISLVLDRMLFKSIWSSMSFIILFNMMVNGIVSLVSLSKLLLLVHRNARNFCVLILYPATLPVSLMSTNRSFLSSGVSIYSIMSSANCGSFISSFQFGFLLLFFIL